MSVAVAVSMDAALPRVSPWDIIYLPFDDGLMPFNANPVKSVKSVKTLQDASLREVIATSSHDNHFFSASVVTKAHWKKPSHVSRST